MKNIVIIPARGGSKRLPNKNVLDLGEIPLIAHSILYAQKNSSIIDEIYVSTDDDKIAAIALQYGAKVIDRPEHLSGDFEPTVSALKHVLESIETNVIGTRNVIDAALDRNVDQVLFVSSDKAVQPINLYGASKMCAERLAIAANSYRGVHGRTRISVIRYGNVLGSRETSRICITALQSRS